ncbi:MAG: Gfo/Idh/MocA family oxidoreductase [Hyphomonadaceae bacterium]|nr:Gfo/Idh/MocA family oxidoreductase [Hyphomonadaceae bacterium]
MTLSDENLNIAVIGYGYWGPNLVRNFAELDGARMHSVADLDETALEKVSRRYPTVQTTTDALALIHHPDIHAVAIATPVSTHFDLAMAALKAGKHVWLEKPMAETAEQARALVAEADARGLILHVDHTFLYTGPVQKMRELVQTSALGDPLYYDSTRVNLGLFQRDVNVISDLAVHDFSILDYVFDMQPTAVSASGINHYPGTPENLAFITLFYETGFIAHVNVSWLAPVKVRKILIGGTEKMITFDELEPSEKLKIYDKGVSFTDDPEQIHEMRVGYRVGDMWAPKVANIEALRNGTEHFRDCILTGKKSISDGRFGLRMVEAIEAATHSMQSRGATVQLPSYEDA